MKRNPLENIERKETNLIDRSSNQCIQSQGKQNNKDNDIHKGEALKR